MKTSIVAAALLFLSSMTGLTQQPAANGAHIIASVGDTAITVPLPNGFSDYATTPKRLQEFILASVGPGNTMIAALMNEPYLQQLTAGRPGPGARHITFQIANELKAVLLPQSDFELLVQETKETLEEEVKTMDMGQINDALNERLSEISKKKLNVILQRSASLGISENGKSHITYLTMAKAVVPSGKFAGDYIVVTSTTTARVRGKVLFIYIHEAFSGAETISGLKAFTKDYVRAVLTTNR